MRAWKFLYILVRRFQLPESLNPPSILPKIRFVAEALYTGKFQNASLSQSDSNVLQHLSAIPGIFGESASPVAELSNVAHDEGSRQADAQAVSETSGLKQLEKLVMIINHYF